MPRKPATPKYPEAQHSMWAKALLHALGFDLILSTEQGFRGEKVNGVWKSKGGTRVTPGLPDLIALKIEPPCVLFCEVKPPHEVAKARKLLASRPVPVTKAKDFRRATAQAEFGRITSAIGKTTWPVTYCYGSLPELCVAMVGRFGYAAVTKALLRVHCPKHIQGDAIQAMEGV